MSRSSRHASIYLSATIFNLGIPFLLLPILTRFIKPGGYAHIAMFQTLCALVSAVAVFGLPSPLLRSFTVEKREARMNYLATCLAVCAVVSVLMVAIVAIFSNTLAEMAVLPRSWLMAAVLAGIATSVFQFKLTTLRAAGEPVRYGVLVNGQTAINFGLSILLVVVLSMDWRGRAAAIIVSSFVMAIWTVISFYRSGMIGKICKKDVREAVSLGAAASLHTILGVLMTNGDRIFLSAGYPPAVLGVYVVAAQLAAGYTVLGAALNLAWAPWAFRRLDAMRTPADRASLLRIMLGLTALIAVGTLVYGLCVYATFGLVVGGKYAQGTVYLPLLLAGAGFQNIYFVFVFPIFYYRQPVILAAGGVVVLAFAVICVFGLSHALGPFGVAVTVFWLRFLMCAIAVGSALYLMRPGPPSAEASQSEALAASDPDELVG